MEAVNDTESNRWWIRKIEEIRRVTTDQHLTIDQIRARRLEWIGHVLRAENERYQENTYEQKGR